MRTALETQEDGNGGAVEIQEDGCGRGGDGGWATEEMKDDGYSGFWDNK